MRRILASLALAFALAVGGASPLQGAEPASTNAVNLPGNLLFGAGGIYGRHVILESWVATQDYPINTILKHGGSVWVAPSAHPSIGEEPGVAAVWQRVTGGAGASITSGTADPTGGGAGDAYIQVDASSVVQSLWRNIAGTWTEYTLTSAGRTLQTGTPIDIAATGGTGASTTVSREDHAHGGFTGPAVRDLLNGLTGVNRLQGAAIRDITAAQASTNVTNFDGNLSNADTTVQAAMDTIDNLTISGITEAAGDARYARLGAENTFTELQTIDMDPSAGSVLEIDAREATSTGAVFNVIVGETFRARKGFSLSRNVGGGLTGWAWGTFDYDECGNSKPGFSLGPGGDGENRDVELCRDAENVWVTGDNDTFRAGQLDVVAGGLAATQANLGIVAGATSTFIADTDTPANYTNAARQFTRVNAGATAIEFVPEPANDNTIPHVGRLPDVADDSPVLVFLTHDEISGSREDATLTVGSTLGRFCGYSRGNIFDAFGTISEDSPIEMVFGVVDTTTCRFSTVHSFNEGFMHDIRTIVFTIDGTAGSCTLGAAYQEYGATTKRITSCQALNDGTDAASFTFNFLYADGTSAYFNDGSTDHRAGLYEKVGTPPAYHDLAPPEDAHRTGEGSAACGDSDPPDAAGQLCVTSDGRGYFAMPRTSLITTPATITVGATASDLFIPDIYLAASLEGRANLNDGNFIYVKTTREFYQYQDPDFEVVTWEEAWQYIIDNVGDTAERQAFLASTFLGEFASESEVQLDRDGFTTPLPAQGTATLIGGSLADITIDFGGIGYATAPTITIEAPDSGTTATATATISDGAVTAITITDAGSGYAAAPEVTFSDPPNVVDYYFLYSDFGTLITISEFTNSIRETISEGFAWRGPVIIPEEVLDVVAANPTDEIDGVLDSILIGSQRFSVIVRPGENGQLRNATESDYDSTYSRSRVVAMVDGEAYKVGRTLIAAHTASGTFTELARGMTFDYDGTTYTYGGTHHNDVEAVHTLPDSFYYNTTHHNFRLRVSDDTGTYWTTLPNGVGLLAAWQWVDTVNNEADALAHSTANGQKFAYQSGTGASGWGVFELSAFTAAEGAHYGYEWRVVTPPSTLPSNTTLVDDVTLTWSGAFRPSVEFTFSEALASGSDGRPILFDFFPNGTSSTARDAGDVILSGHVREITDIHPLRLTKTGDGGADNPVDTTAALLTPRPSGFIHFHLPISSGANPDHRLTMFYAGDHVTDLDGQIGTDETTISVSSGDTANLTVGEDYWLAGPTTGDCQSSPYFEKITVLTIVDGNDITVTRGVDGTGLTGLACFMNSGADVIHDDKRTFILESTHDDQDSALISFTLLAQGVGGGIAVPDAGDTGGGGILKQKYVVSSSTEAAITDTTWVDIASQAVTVAANDRVYLDGVAFVEMIGGAAMCDLRFSRGGTLVGAESRVESYVTLEMHSTAIRVMDTPGAGTHTYTFQIQEDGTAGSCNVNPDGTSSFATIEVLGANP